MIFSMDKYLFAGVCLQNARPSNMDSLLLKPKRVAGEEAVLSVVCDGVGSLVDGGFASGMAVRLLGDWFNGIDSAENIGAKLMDFLYNANVYLVDQAEKRNIETASTISALLLIGNTYYVVHLGDSRIYSHTKGSLSLITKDDSSPEGKLTGYIGRKRDIYPQYYEGDAAGKMFLLCSDGFHKRMDADFLVQYMDSLGISKKDLDNAGAELTQQVIDKGERDNITLALIRSVS